MPLPRPRSSRPGDMYQWAVQMTQALEAQQGQQLPFAHLQTLKKDATGATFDFNISQDFSHLILIGNQNNGTGGLGVGLRFNGDSSSTYAWEDLTASAAAVSAAQTTGTGDARIAASWNSGFVSSFTCIPGYRDRGGNLQLISIMFGHDGTNWDVRLIGGVWGSAVAVTTMQIILEGAGSFAVGSKFSLYGVR